MTHKHNLDLSLAQIFHQLMGKTVETIWQKKKDFQVRYRVVGVEVHEITLAVRKIEPGKPKEIEQ